MNSVTVNLTRLDYFIAQCRLQSRHPVNIGGWLLLSGILAFNILRQKPPSFPMILLGSIVTLAICATFLAAITVVVSVAMALLARRERGVLGEHSYRFTDSGLVESTVVNEQLIKWGGVRALLRTRHYCYVRVTFAMFYTIPRRHFADAAADAEFWKALQPLVAKKVS